jgi:hypothetical protein
MARPAYVTDAMLTYLDRLRESGTINMFGAGPWVRREFRLDKATSDAVLSYWMETFGKEDR